MEIFSSCWADEDKPYLLPLHDTPEHAEGSECFCNTRDKEILGQVLNNYDQETVDFYRWKVEYNRQEISELISRRSGYKTGILQGMEVLGRGPSGRITSLRITGTEKTLVVGKELEIRRLLSESHLKSSAFDITYLNEEGQAVENTSDWTTVRLDGSGWGHGVGLCQIGAAVMASKGYGYKEILQHYYPNTHLSS